MILPDGKLDSAEAQAGDGADATGPRASNAASEESGSFEAAARAGVQVLEIGTHIATLLEVYGDRARASMRRKIVQFALGALAMVGLAVAIAAASFRVVVGLSGAFAELFEGKAWAGDLVGGGVVLLGVAAWIAAGLALWRRSQLRSSEAKYAERRRRHAQHFGSETETHDAAPAH